MRTLFRPLCLLFGSLSFAAPQLAAQAPATGLAVPAAAKADYSGEALVFDRSETILRMKADGTGERLQRVRMHVQSEGAVKQFSVLSFYFAADSETPHISGVRVTKPDGTKIETPATDALDVTAEVTREAPLYSDVKQKQLPVRSLAVGDTLEYEVRTTIDKPEAPGQFWGADHFTAPGTLVVREEIYTLEFPSDKYVQVWSPNHKPTRTEHDGLVTYTWNVAQLVSTPKPADADDPTKKPKDPDQDADGRLVPSLAFTTFHSWAEVGDWYRALALPRTEPTDAVRAKADDLTRDAKTPEEQARALYRYVSHIRYVGLDLGVGRYQPHLAAEVLATQYGDCKDKDTLLEALLRAKGLKPAPALIGFGITPLPDVPSPAVFNHVITTVDLPSGRIWLDATAETAPFRLLNPGLREEEALVVPPAAPAALIKTPAELPFPFVSHFDAVATLDADGLLKAHIEISLHSDDEVPMRAAVQQLAPTQWDAGMQYLSSNMGFGGKVSNADLRQKPTGATDEPLHMSYDYSKDKFADWANLRILPLLPPLGLAAPPDEAHAKADPADVQLGPRQVQQATTKITLPPGFRADLPDPIHAANRYLTLDKTYRFSDGVITVERKLVVLETKVPRTDLKSYAAFYKQVHEGDEYYIQLTAAHGGHTVDAASPKSSDTGESAEDLISRANSLEQIRDLAGASALLDKARKISDSTPYLWSNYGYIELTHHNFDEAIADFHKELERHPDEGHVVVLLSLALKQSGKTMPSRKVLADYFDAHTGDREVTQALVSSQTAAQQYGGAVTTLEIATAAQPNDLSLKVLLANTLLLDGRKTDAAKAAKAALDAADADDYEILNDAGYALAESGIDLPYAERSSRIAINVLEAQTAAITPAEVNSSAYAKSNLLIASWDTLGWILYLNGKLDEAEPLLVAAWRNSYHPEVGDHLGQLYEEEGKPKQAYELYGLASSSREGSRPPAVEKHIQSSLSALRPKGDHTDFDQALLKARMVPLKRVPGADGAGTFRLQLTSAGVADFAVSLGRSLDPAARKLYTGSLLRWTGAARFESAPAAHGHHQLSQK